MAKRTSPAEAETKPEPRKAPRPTGKVSVMLTENLGRKDTTLGFIPNAGHVAGSTHSFTKEIAEGLIARNLAKPKGDK